jgi:pimeloyl-ACP methyl ester carboxylesterase
MARRNVHVQRKLPMPAETAWAVLRNFIGKWHPIIAAISKETRIDGKVIRRFTCNGDDIIYREQLTYFSNSDRELSYKLLQGIAGAENYHAAIKVTDQIIWTACFDADEPRASEITLATQAIFEMGLDALTIAQPQEIAPKLKIRSDIACVFLHGIGGRKENWDMQIPIAAQFMQSFALDLRGYGSADLGNYQSTIDDYCNDILQEMKVRQIDKIILCGLSYGSWIATSFAMRHPDKLLGLALSGGCTGMSEASADVRAQFQSLRAGPLQQGKTPADIAPDILNIIAGPHISAPAKQELYESMAAISTATYLDALHCFTHPTEVFDFSKLTMPVLFITGEFDRLATPAEIRSVAARVVAASPLPAVRFEIISDAGHVCNVEMPNAFKP